MNTEGDPLVTYRKRRSRYTGEFDDIQQEDISSDMEQRGIHSDKGKGMGQAAVERLRTLIYRIHGTYIADLPTGLPCLTSWQIQ